MIVTKEFIWRKDHFVFHITEEKNIYSISRKGLLPRNGKRCKSIMDERKGVFCLDGIQKVQEWSKILYKKEEFKGLILLRFNLKNRKWHMDLSNDFVFGLYLPYKVIPEKIDYLDIKDISGKKLEFTKLFDEEILSDLEECFNNQVCNKDIVIKDCVLRWIPILEYNS